jgi:hypothetical protein
VCAGLEVRFYSDEGCLDGAADGAGADEVDAVKVGEDSGDVLAFFLALGCQVGNRYILIVRGVVIAFGVAEEVDGAGRHGSNVECSEGGV